METPADLTELSSVSFADFTETTKTSEDNVPYFAQTKEVISLDLSLQKTENLFASDQTPTPTKLIKNCDEVGLFEDLQHVNPFDIGFQRAAEQNVNGTPSTTNTTEGDSLHTPQVYPSALDSVVASSGTGAESTSPLDVEQLLANTTALPIEGPPPLQLIQPQVIAYILPLASADSSKVQKSSTNTIPVQTVRPFILPKPNSNSVASKTPAPLIVTPQTTLAHEPSSASLTPTSQLPIKERLKAIIHHNNKNKHNKRHFTPPPADSSKTKPNRDEDCMERRRAAATRYRNKMRNEHKELRQQNAQLQQENRELRDRIARLKRELQEQDRNNNLTGALTNQLQIPPSAIHLVINVPKIFVPSSTTSSLSTEKK